MKHFILGMNGDLSFCSFAIVVAVFNTEPEGWKSDPGLDWCNSEFRAWISND